MIFNLCLILSLFSGEGHEGELFYLVSALTEFTKRVVHVTFKGLLAWWHMKDMKGSVWVSALTVISGNYGLFLQRTSLIPIVDYAFLWPNVILFIKIWMESCMFVHSVVTKGLLGIFIIFSVWLMQSQLKLK